MACWELAVDLTWQSFLLEQLPTLLLLLLGTSMQPMPVPGWLPTPRATSMPHGKRGAAQASHSRSLWALYPPLQGLSTRGSPSRTAHGSGPAGPRPERDLAQSCNCRETWEAGLVLKPETLLLQPGLGLQGQMGLRGWALARAKR